MWYWAGEVAHYMLFALAEDLSLFPSTHVVIPQPSIITLLGTYSVGMCTKRHYWKAHESCIHQRPTL